MTKNNRYLIFDFDGKEYFAKSFTEDKGEFRLSIDDVNWCKENSIKYDTENVEEEDLLDKLEQEIKK